MLHRILTDSQQGSFSEDLHLARVRDKANMAASSKSRAKDDKFFFINGGIDLV